jgi:hypothetical protein
VTELIPGSYELQVAVVAAEAHKQEDNSKLEQYSKQAVSLKNAEGYKKSDCEDLTCDLKTSCVPHYSDIRSV